MVEIIGIKFKNAGKIYYFAPMGEKYKLNDNVLVETVHGVEMGVVVVENCDVSEDSVVAPLKPVVRKATDEDMRQAEANKEKEKKAFEICEKQIEEHGLKMKLTSTEYTFDGSKILFYFTADGRVDFRALVKSLASIFKTRIELRQIGVRDEARLLGGIGICGRPLCCRQFLADFEPVSIKMAKEQNLSLNPTKISGVCGRLMCCLKYEQSTYEQLLKYTPSAGAIVRTPDGKGKVTESSVLTGKIKVIIDGDDTKAPKTYDLKDLVIIKDAEIRLTADEIKELKKLEDKN